MSVDPQRTLRDTFEKAVSKNGIVLFALFSFSSLFLIVAVESRAAATEATGPFADRLPDAFVEVGFLTFDIPRSYAVALTFVSLFVGSYFAVVATRVFVNGHRNIPKETYSEDVILTTLNMFLATLAFFPLFFGSLLHPLAYVPTLSGFVPTVVLAAVVLVMSVLTGAFIAVSFAFYPVYICVEGEDFIDSFSESWKMSSGNRKPLFVLFIAFLVVTIAVASFFISGYIALWEISTLLAQLMLAFGVSAALVFTLALISTIFRKHRRSLA